MRASDHQRLLDKISKLYYEQEQTQSQISKRLHLSRQQVQRMLKEAHQESIMQARWSILLNRRFISCCKLSISRQIEGVQNFWYMVKTPY